LPTESGEDLPSNQWSSLWRRSICERYVMWNIYSKGLDTSNIVYRLPPLRLSLLNTPKFVEYFEKRLKRVSLYLRLRTCG